MENRAIYITRHDMQRLRELLENPDLMQQKPYLEPLRRELDRADVVEPAAIPSDTITMNSTVRLTDIQTGEELVLTLTYPDEASISAGKISVLAPIGTAILGCRETDTVEWEVPEGVRALRVERVLDQPEARGEYSQ